MAESDTRPERSLSLFARHFVANGIPVGLMTGGLMAILGQGFDWRLVVGSALGTAGYRWFMRRPVWAAQS